MKISYSKQVILTFVFTASYLVQAIAQAPIISYPTNNQIYSVGVPINPMILTNTGGGVSFFGLTSTVAGDSSFPGFSDGSGANANFNTPLDVAVDALGNIYVADAENNRIRKITPLGLVSTLAGSGETGIANGSASIASFHHPAGLAVDASGNVYVADQQNNAIRKVTPAGNVTTLAGSGSPGSANGTGGAASFNSPTGVAVDGSGNVYVADYANNMIRKITPSGVVTTVAGNGTVGATDAVGTSATFHNPMGVAIDAGGNLYVADRVNYKIRKITSSGQVTTLAGSGSAGYANGQGSAASFNSPNSLTLDASGNIYVVDEGNQVIRKVTSTGLVSTFVGSGSTGTADGASASFNNPFGIAIDGVGNFYVADDGNSLIRKIILVGYTITPILPAGLNLDASTGTISGTPNRISPSTNYTITASNDQGVGNENLNISVVSGSPASGQNQNYIIAFTPRTEITDVTQMAGRGVGDVNQIAQYFDGLGRPIQTVQYRGSPSQHDMIQPIVYDQYGKESTKYLPYINNPALPSDGSYKNDAINKQQQFYNQATTWVSNVVTTPFPYAQTSFEFSPLNRVLDQGAVGDNWQLIGTLNTNNAGHTEKINYESNDATDLATGSGYWTRQYSVNIDANNNRTLLDQGSYPINQLTVTVIRDENWTSGKLGTTEEYKDRDGKILLKRDFNLNSTGNTETLSTYYVYDDYGSLCYVLPPVANPDAGNISIGVINDFCFQYQYDGQNRMIQKRIPGKGWEYMVYNKLDQVVATQDSNQRIKPIQEWTINKYDALGRILITGIWQQSGSIAGTNYLSTVQTNVDSQINQWDTPATIANGSSITWPTTWTNTLTINYYDNYNITGLPSNYIYTGTDKSDRTQGLLTASQVAVLNDPGNMLWTVYYYDQEGRNIKTYQQHYLGGSSNYSVANYDDITNTYDFTNAITQTIRNHYNVNNSDPSNPVVSITNNYVYDHIGRKLQNWEKINNDGQILLSQLEYNEVGQLYKKYLHRESNNGLTASGTDIILSTTDALASGQKTVAASNSITLQPGFYVSQGATFEATIVNATTPANLFLQTITYTYNERGWLTQASAPLFAYQLQYNAGNNPQYNGNITQQDWGTFSNNTPNYTTHYTYTYDKLNRLTAGMALDGSTGESNISYDPIGNIQTLKRYRNTSLVDDMTYKYTNLSGVNTNQLQSVTDNSNDATSLYLKSGTSNYQYDGNGNVSSDGSKGVNGINIAYNMLDLPQIITGDKTLTYVYDANGQKLRSISNTTSIGTLDYISGINYNNGVIEAVQTEEGRAVRNNDNTYHYEYILPDHLGNSRRSFYWNPTTANTEIIQSEDYYAFGMRMDNVHGNPDNKYLYNEKELQEDLQQYDYGARFYDPVIARWTSGDPLAEKMRRYTPYNYGNDNPIRFVDPDGMSGTDWVKLGGMAGGAYLWDYNVHNTAQAQATYGANATDVTPDGHNYVYGQSQQVELFAAGGFDSYYSMKQDPTSGQPLFQDWVKGFKAGINANGTGLTMAEDVGMATTAIAVPGGEAAAGDGLFSRAVSRIFGEGADPDVEVAVKYIGRMEDLTGIPREQTLLDDLPDLGSPKANYYQNMSILRKAIRDGYELIDQSAFRPASEAAPTLSWPTRTIGQTFYGAERNLLINSGIWP
jgi:RHS repeat-associated protein